jgi:thioredoxin-like negative regulator of GroEL
MSDTSAFDEFRDLLDGRLDPAAAARLRVRLASDAALAAEFAAFSEVHAFTAPAACAAVPTSGVSLEALDAARHAGRVRRLRPWMAVAASLLLVAAGAAALHHFNPPQGTVTLRAISLTPSIVVAAPPAKFPAVLADYRPVRDGALHWIPTLDEGRAVARATGRPILLWIYHPSCPVCVQWDRGSFRESGVIAEAERFVPVKVNVMSATKELEPFLTKGWPYLGALSADGREVVDFAGEQSAAELRGHLEKALASQGAAAALPWSDVNEAASALARGEKALAQGDVAGAYREFSSVASRDAKGSFGAAARARVDEIAADAADALRESQKRAETDEAAGARSLSEAAERFRGTPYGLDLAEVEQELRATGRFPVLIEGTTKSQ